MTFLTPSLAPLITPNADPSEWMTAIGEVLGSGPFTNTWTVDSGSACRIVFTFENGLRIAWVGDSEGLGNEPTLIQMWDVNSRTTSVDAPGECPLPGAFTWSPDTQTWAAIADATTATDIITSAVSRYGAADLVLPWESLTREQWVENITTCLGSDLPFWEALASVNQQEFDDVLAEIDDEVDDDAPFVRLFAAAALDAVVCPAVWGGQPASVYMGDSELPPASPLANFYRFMEAMTQKKDWVIVWDECCGTCFGGTYNMLRESQGLPEGAPALALFGQNAQYSWRPDATLNYEFHLRNQDEVETVATEARKVGLRVKTLPHETRVTIS